MYKIRFHLASGKNYKKWQIREKSGRVRYYDPANTQLELVNCRLVNYLKKAKKVHAEGKKDVAGWIECEDVMVTQNEIPVDNLERVFYNPIMDPHWRRDSDDGEFVWDDSRYSTLVTQDRRVYILEERS